MADPNNNLPFNRQPATPSLADLISQVQEDILFSINCHALGTIQSFNPNNQSATVTINYPRGYYVKQNNGSYGTVFREYPPLLNCPVIILGGGDASLTFPIKKGDQCLLLFNDRDIDNWFKGAPNTTPLASDRLHSLSDGIALVGLKRPISEYDEDHGALVWGDVKLGVGEEKILFENATLSLLSVLTDLLTAITSLNTALSTAFAAATPTAGNPLNPAAVTAIAAVQTQINAVQSELGDLLE